MIYANGLYGNDHDILALLIDIDCRRLMRIGTSSGEFRDLFMPFVLMSSPSAFNSWGVMGSRQLWTGNSQSPSSSMDNPPRQIRAALLLALERRLAAFAVHSPAAPPGFGPFTDRQATFTAHGIIYG